MSRSPCVFITFDQGSASLSMADRRRLGDLAKVLAGVTGEMLAAAYLRATEERPEDRVDLSHVTVDAVTVAETVANLARQLPRQGPTTFRSLVEGIAVRLEIIVHFLAVLELCKLGRVSLGQGSTFGDLQISWLGDEPDPDSIISGTLEVDDYDG